MCSAKLDFRKKLIDSISDTNQRIFIKFCTLLNYSVNVIEQYLKKALEDRAFKEYTDTDVLLSFLSPNKSFLLFRSSLLMLRRSFIGVSPFLNFFCQDSIAFIFCRICHSQVKYKTWWCCADLMSLIESINFFFKFILGHKQYEWLLIQINNF